MEVLNIKFNPPIFTQYIQPTGFFPHDINENRGVHALWYYYITALEILKFKVDGWQYEDEPNKEDLYNLEGLHKNIAFMYGVEPSHMNRYWDVVDKQAIALGYRVLPDAMKFASVLEIFTQ